MNKSTNKELIEEILNFIEDHLYDENLNLDCIIYIVYLLL